MKQKGSATAPANWGVDRNAERHADRKAGGSAGAQTAHGSDTSAETGVERGIGVFALVWQAGWSIGQAGMRADATDTAAWAFLLASASGISIGLLLAFAPQRLRLRHWLGGIDAAALIIAAAACTAAGGVDKSASGANLTLLAIGVAGLLLPLPAGASLAGIAIGVETAQLALAQATGQLDDWRTLLLAPVYAIGVSIAVLAGRHYAMAAGRRSDQATDSLVASRSEAESARRRAESARGSERLLHETVLNTLNAIAGGTPDTTRLRERCRQAADVLAHMSEDESSSTSIPGASRPVRDELADALEQVRASGSSIEEQGLGMRLDSIPSDVREGFIGAMREALLNCARHAEAAHVSIRLTQDGSGVSASIDDDGQGFNPSANSRGMGISGYIQDGMKGIGGTSRIDSRAGHGCHIRLEWQESPLSVPSGIGSVALPILAGFGLFATTSCLATLTLADKPGSAIAALIVMAVLSAVMLTRHGADSLSAWRTIAVCAGAPAVYWLQQQAYPPEGAISWTHWGSEAMIGLLLVACCIGPAWTILVAGSAWLIAMGDPLHELTQPGPAILIGGALLARSVRRGNHAHQKALEAKARQDSDERADRETARSLKVKYQLLDDSQARSLLLAIAAGSIDVNSEDTQESARVEERFIRTIMRLDPGRRIDSMARQLAVHARRAGVPLEVDVAGAGEASAGLERVAGALTQAVMHARAGSPARLSARAEGTETVIRLVAVLDSCPEQWPGVRITHADGISMLEARMG